MRAHLNSVTCDGLEAVRNLQDELALSQRRLKQNEALMAELATANKKLAEPLDQVMVSMFGWISFMSKGN